MSTTGRHLEYCEEILGQIHTGVFILEELEPGVPESLTVTMVNSMGAEFFGQAGASHDELLREACN